MAPKRRATAAAEISSSEDDAWAPSAASSGSESGGTGTTSDSQGGVLQAKAAKPAPAGQPRRASHAAALQQLHAARQQGKQRSRQQAARSRRAVVSSDDEPPCSDGDDQSADDDPHSPVRPAPARRQRRSGGRAPTLVTGYRDYNAEDLADDDALGDFIVSEEDHDEEEKVQEDSAAGAAPGKEASGAEADGAGRGRHAAAHPPRAALAAVVSEDSSEGAPSNQRHSGRKRPRPSAIVVLDSSSSEEELPELRGMLAPETQQHKEKDEAIAPRRRLRKAADKAEPHGAAPDRLAAAGKAAQDAPIQDKGGPSLPPPKTQQLPAPSPRQRRSVVNARKQRLSAAQRILQAQQEFQSQQPGGVKRAKSGEGEGTTSHSDLEEEEEEEEGANVLTDEGEPSSSSSGVSSDEGGPVEGEQQQARGSRRGGTGAEGSVAIGAAARSPGWQRAAEALGIGQLSEEELFSVYVEFMLLCHVDPGYKASVEASAKHSAYYARAVRQCEWLLTRKRDAVASAAWRSCTEGLLEAMESLPGVESGWSSCDPTADMDVLDLKPCDACNRKLSHTTRVVVFKGRPVQGQEAAGEAWQDAGSNRRLGDTFKKASPVYVRRRGWRKALDSGSPGGGSPLKNVQGALFLDRWEEERQLRGGGAGGPTHQHQQQLEEEVKKEEEEGEESEEESDEESEEGCGPYQRVEFRVGRYCAARLLLYHGLFHWKHRLLARLKKELKMELSRRKRLHAPVDPAAVADAVLSKESLLSSLYANYRTLLSLAERYELAGGEGATGWRGQFATMHDEVVHALADLHPDSEGEESSVQWPEEGENYDEEEGEEGSGREEESKDWAHHGFPASGRGGEGGSRRQMDIRNFLGGRGG